MPFAWDDGCATGAAEVGAVHFKRGPCLCEAIPIKNDSCKQDGSKPAPNEQHFNMLYDIKHNLQMGSHFATLEDKSRMTTTQVEKQHPCKAKKAMKVGWEGGYAT